MKVFSALLFCAFSLQVAARQVKPFKDATSGRYGFKDESGKTVVEAKYRSAEGFCEGLALVSSTEENYGFVDFTGKEVIPLIYAGGMDFKGGFAVVSEIKKNQKKRGAVDKTGKVVVPLKYDELYTFNSGAFTFQLGKKQGFIDGTGQELWSSTKYEYVGHLLHGMSLVSKSHKYGYIDKTGKEIVPVKYEMAEPYNEEGFGKVKSKEIYFLLDSLGNLANGNAGFNISSTVAVAKERWVVVLSKRLEAKEPVYFLTASSYGKFAAPFGASITWQIVDNKSNVIKEERMPAGQSVAFRVPADGIYTVQAYYDMKDCIGCRTEDKPAAFNMEYSFNTKL